MIEENPKHVLHAKIGLSGIPVETDTFGNSVAHSTATLGEAVLEAIE